MSVVLVACALAGVLSLGVSSDARATTPVLFHDDFESGGLSNWTSNSGLAAQQSHVFRGAWAAEATATGGPAGPSAYKDLTQGKASLYYETWFEIVSQTTNVNLLRFRNNLGGHNSIATLFVSSTGKLGLRNDVTAVPTTSTTAVSKATWHTAEVHVTINGASSSTEVWLDHTLIATLSQSGINLGTNPVGRIELGDPSASRTFDVAFDNVDADPAFIADSAAPTAPANLHTTSVAATQVDIAWDAASDDVGVTGYQILRNGSATPIASVGATPRSYSNTGLTGGTTYTYRVRAVDAAGNVSAASGAATATTPKANQTIAFAPLANKRYGDPVFKVHASASSGLRVFFAGSGRCTVSGATVHLNGVGSCKVTASQPGNAHYNPAPAVSRSFAIKRPLCRVPKVVGRRLRAAEKMIATKHCRTGKVRHAYSRKRQKGIVISQSRRPGRVLPGNSKINLVVSRGRKG